MYTYVYVFKYIYIHIYIIHMIFPQLFFVRLFGPSSQVEDLHLAVLAAEAFGATGHPAGTGALRVGLGTWH